MTAKSKIIAIQAARGFAALLVVLYHSGRMLALPQYFGRNVFGDVFKFGHAGVDFFFTLSGFIIFYVHYRDIGIPNTFRRYAWRRLTRIYPIYWFVTIIALTLALLSHDPEKSVGFPHIVASFLLLPQAMDPLVGPAWTLEHEMLFYLLFALAVLSRRFGMIVFAVWLASILGKALGLLGDHLSFIAAFYHLQFFAGIAVAYAAIYRPPSHPIALAVTGVLGFLATGILENLNLIAWGGHLSALLFGAAGALTLLGLATAERSGRLQVGSIGAFFGAASYALYLVHTIVIGLFAHTLASLGLIRLFPGWSVGLAAAAMAVVVASLLHRFVELPMMLYLQPLTASQPRFLAGTAQVRLRPTISE